MDLNVGYNTQHQKLEAGSSLDADSSIIGGRVKSENFLVEKRSNLTSPSKKDYDPLVATGVKNELEFLFPPLTSAQAGKGRYSL